MGTQRFARALSVALIGLRGTVVEVETDIGSQLPSFNVLGLPDLSVRESKDRVRSAARNSGVPLSPRQITVNLTPATLPKKGSHFDLAIAASILQADGVMPPAPNTVYLAELALDGALRPVRGILPAVLAAVTAGNPHVVVAQANAAEAALVPGAVVRGHECLADVLAAAGADPRKLVRAPIRTDTAVAPQTNDDATAGSSGPDLADVAGQYDGRAALELAAAGGHHLLLCGPPGAGKTLLAERLPGLLPGLDDAAATEVTAVHSLDARVSPRTALIRRPPFESPHHSASAAALLGGGSGIPRPGAVSRAHHGVLFLDEAPEFDRGVLDSLRQPLETGTVRIDRAATSAQYPARFQLVMAANPCPCGRSTGKAQECRCTPRERRSYFGKLSGPLLDRVDLRINVPAVSYAELTSAPTGEDSATVAARVAQARTRQRERLAAYGVRCNAEIGASLLTGELRRPPKVTAALERDMERGVLTARGVQRVLRVAWTVADLDGRDAPDAQDVDTALYFRSSELA
ncbi:YifB family Mg chelatase-like AAA ATPase [Kocuria sp.]|uniref:YifB family Mg chelatase-like AAA ATPase n=1 Tax=Kocuria sp. TaxID=1871328 RepID=UPI0026DEF971|nr:YifB family Mg chelatase-like AAA ATPase [Kocuria sp.]MDO5618285.1 YifB family Mg chelatase-like AAA ATPase [Kocuria sp.]